jgi:hypothetical protein
MVRALLDEICTKQIAGIYVRRKGKKKEQARSQRGIRLGNVGCRCSKAMQNHHKC